MLDTKIIPQNREVISFVTIETKGFSCDISSDGKGKILLEDWKTQRPVIDLAITYCHPKTILLGMINEGYSPAKLITMMHELFLEEWIEDDIPATPLTDFAIDAFKNEVNRDK